MTEIFGKKIMTMYFQQNRGNPRVPSAGQRPVVCVAHLLSNIEWISNPVFANYRKILLVRDPRDVIVSFYHHIMKRKGWPLATKFNRDGRWTQLPFDEQVDKFLAFPENTPIDGIHSSLILLQDPNIFVVRFEDLVGARGGGSDELQLMTLMNLASFIGQPKTIEEIKAAAPRLFGGTWTFRKGQIGEWKNFFKPGHLEILKSLIGREVIELGYESDFNW
jgi:hypothetical protein